MAQFSNFLSQSPLHLQLRSVLAAARRVRREVALLLIGIDAYAGSTRDGTGRTQMVQQASLHIRAVLRESDTTFQLEGGRLAVLLPSVRGSDDAVVVAKKILNAFDQPLLLDERRVRLRARIGIALFPAQSRTADALVEHASQALNAAERGGDRLVVYSQPALESAYRALRMSDLRQSIVEDQLFLVFQPKVNLRTGLLSGVESLVRWNHPQFGLIEPDEFIPVAEQTGLITPLTLWVLHRSLLQCGAWRRAGIELTVAVNLSMLNLPAPELPGQIAGLLRDTGIAARELELEITESAIMDDPERTLCTLQEIRRLGVRLAIDDFGTGYSSLAYLSRLPVTTIKIDKSFIQSLGSVKENTLIVRSIIDLAHNLGLNVVAEGVETAAAKEMLSRLECDEAQGYYFGHPRIGSEISRMFGRPLPVPEPAQLVAKEL
ncbi:MAG TPA: bifunctional diguanylate cyclase/phosphodiesterase [Candidatus Eisenbacteria bacterium]|nr:bifunctional diguanylate cyclase/phosphodiesterase [Candidatus Eisenbacteria bacterium]